MMCTPGAVIGEVVWELFARIVKMHDWNVNVCLLVVALSDAYRLAEKNLLGDILST
jgi:hypothetical protein